MSNRVILSEQCSQYECVMSVEVSVQVEHQSFVLAEYHVVTVCTKDHLGTLKDFLFTYECCTVNPCKNAHLCQHTHSDVCLDVLYFKRISCLHTNVVP